MLRQIYSEGKSIQNPPVIAANPEKLPWVTPRLYDLSSEGTESGGLPTVNESSLAPSFSSHDFAPDS
jgi:hypothetical protein